MKPCKKRPKCEVSKTRKCRPTSHNISRGSGEPVQVQLKASSPPPAVVTRRESPPAKLNTGSTTKSTPNSTMKKSLSSPKPLSNAAPPRQPQSSAAVNQRTPSIGPPGGQGGKVDLVECRICKRHFAKDRIQTHESICKRTGQKKRKEYDATKHRVAGTEAEIYVKRGNKPGAVKSKQVQVKKPDWRKKHEEFITTIRAAKEMKAHLAAGGKLSDLPPPPPLDTSDYIECPHCHRRFNEAAAERHIPRCATMVHNKPKNQPPAKAGPSTVGARRR